MSGCVKDSVTLVLPRLYIDFSVLQTDKIGVLNDYVITDDVERHLMPLIDAFYEILRERKKTFLVAGGYGTGKSYFLVFSSLILESLLDPDTSRLVESKLAEKRRLAEKFRSLQQKDLKLLPVRINLKMENRAEPIHGIIVAKAKEAAMECLHKELTLPYEWEEISKGIGYLEKAGLSDRLDKALRRKSLTLEKLKDLVKERNYQVLKAFAEAYREEFKFYPHFMTVSLDKILDGLLASVKQDGYDGVVFLVDELQKFLETSSKAKDDLLSLEALSEATTGRPIVVVTSVLKISLARMYPWWEDYDKFASRFEPFTFLLEGLADILHSKLRLKEELREKLRGSRATSLLDRDNITLLHKIYPLNPITFRFLKLVTQHRAAERTAFSFLQDAWDKVKDSAFISEDGKLVLITPDYLYDYFFDDFRERAPEIIEEVGQLLGVLSSDEQRYLKCMATATELEGKISKKDLSQAFLDEEDKASQLMMKIVTRSPRTFTPIIPYDTYAIRPIEAGVRFVVKAFFDKVKNPIDNLVEMLNEANASIRNWMVDGVSREIEVVFCPLSKSIVNLSKGSKKTRLLVILPDAQRIDLQDAQVTELLKLSGDSNVLIFVIEQRIREFDILKEFFAARIAAREGRLAREVIVNYEKNTLPVLDELFKSNNISVWHKERKITKRSNLISVRDEQTIVEETFLNEVLQEVFRRLYPIYSELATKFLGEVDLSRRGYTNDIITRFIATGKIPADIEQGKSATKHVRDLAEPIGLAERRGENYVFCLPSMGIQRKVVEMFKSEVESKTSTSEVYKSMSTKGFPDPLIELYLAALLTAKQVMILDEDRNYVRFDVSNPERFLEQILNIVKESKKGKSYYINLAKPFPQEKWVLLREFLKGLVAPIEILEQETLAEDQVPEIYQLMKEEIPRCLEKLSEMAKYLKKYDDKLSRLKEGVKGN